MNLNEHRINIKNNVDAYKFDLERCYKSVVPHLKKAGYKRITYKRAEIVIKKYVDMIFLAQNSKPFFHIESKSGLPYCWNVTNHWDKNYIRYEWGHLDSKNMNGKDADNIENLCLQSARCNQHIQSSMNVEELLEYGGKLKEVINRNLDNRNRLFNSSEWKKLIDELNEWK